MEVNASQIIIFLTAFLPSSEWLFNNACIIKENKYIIIKMIFLVFIIITVLILITNYYHHHYYLNYHFSRPGLCSKKKLKEAQCSELVKSRVPST